MKSTPPNEPLSIRDAPGQDLPAPPWPERARIEGKRVRTAFRVRYAETDRMGVAYYANYLVWFEVLRGDFMRAIGIPYTGLEADGYLLPISEAHVRYLAPVHYDEVVELVGWIREVGSRRVTFSYRAECGGRLLATGWTRHISVGPNGRPRPLPAETRRVMDGLVLADSPDER